ncbi:Fic/DOC family protein [Acholeplasma granularum]|uniref:Fic/DOC family protein n=1 Tax=Acholeplasma granularum TaxID=264635 RepID=UPI00047246A0|nr:Fic family protein [Acholeplasma granularum]
MNDLYFYPGTNTHVNIMGIQDKALLKTYTANQFGLAMLKIQKNPPLINSAFDFLTVHKMLFDNVFYWAGKIRTVNMTTSEFILADGMVQFADFDSIEEELNQVDLKYKDYPWRFVTKSEFISHLAEFIVDLWLIHPLREGNTRTLIVFMDLFVRKFGYHIDLEGFNLASNDLRNAFVWGAIGEFLNIKTIFNRIVVKNS